MNRIRHYFLLRRLTLRAPELVDHLTESPFTLRIAWTACLAGRTVQRHARHLRPAGTSGAAHRPASIEPPPSPPASGDIRLASYARDWTTLSGGRNRIS